MYQIRIHKRCPQINQWLKIDSGIGNLLYWIKHCFEQKSHRKNILKSNLLRIDLLYTSSALVCVSTTLTFVKIIVGEMWKFLLTMLLFNLSSDLVTLHDDVMKWKHFPCYWPFVRGISSTKASDVWCFLWSASEKTGWENNREAGDLRRNRAHYDVIVMCLVSRKYVWSTKSHRKLLFSK